MKLPQAAVIIASSLFTPVAMMFLQDTVKTMMPWIIVMLSVVTCDLIAGIRKSLKLGVHVSWSMAFRETMGKMVVYVAFVMMVAFIDAATEHEFAIAKWGSLFICAIEGGSIISNLLKPYGVELSVRGIVSVFARRTFGEGAEEAVDGDGLDVITERERKRWEEREKHRHGANEKTVKEKERKRKEKV